MVRMARQNTVPARRPRPEPRCRYRTGHHYPPLRQGILLGNLPPRRIPGYRLVGQRPPKKEKIQILLCPSPLMAPIHRPGDIHHNTAARTGCHCRNNSPIQRLRTYRPEPIRPNIRLVQQPARILRRTRRQLCILLDRSLDSQHSRLCHRRRNIRRSHRARMAEWPNILQYNMPRRNPARMYLQILNLASGHRP